MILQRLKTLIMAQNPLIEIVGTEETRYIREMLRLDQPIFYWTLSRGLRAVDRDRGFRQIDGSAGEDLKSPMRIIDYIGSTQAMNGIYVLSDFHVFFDNAQIVRNIKDTASELRDYGGRNVVITCPLNKTACGGDFWLFVTLNPVK